jgi:hypothetical protein
MSKYEPLGQFLHELEGPDVWLTFKEIEERLGFKLPQSAHRHRGWWANEPVTHVQARAWMNADWQVWLVNLPDQRVRFRHRRAAPPSPNQSGGDPVETFVVHVQNLSGPARVLLERHAREHACSFEHATADLLAQAGIARKRRLLERFPLSGERSSVDSVDLIREERDARDAR